jgi:hypothetical protein
MALYHGSEHDLTGINWLSRRFGMMCAGETQLGRLSSRVTDPQIQERQ